MTARGAIKLLLFKGKITALHLITLLPTSFAAEVQFKPSYSFYQADPSLSDLFYKGASNLCWPAAMANAVMYLERARPMAVTPITDLKISELGPKTTREFFEFCQTDSRLGSYIDKSFACVKNYLTESKINSYAAVFGKAGNLAGTDQYYLESVSLQKLKKFLKYKFAVILHIAYYSRSKDKTWSRGNGHYLNLIGYEDQNQREILAWIMDPAKNYLVEKDSSFFDKFVIRETDAQGGAIAENVLLELEGGAYKKSENYRVLVEDILVFSPVGTINH